MSLRPSVGLLLLCGSVVFVVPLAGQQKPDSTKAKPAAPVPKPLPPIEVLGTIQPSAGPTLGSGIPARITTLTGKQVDAFEPRILADVLGQQAGFSTYDDLGSSYKLNVVSRGFSASPVVGQAQGISVFLDGVRQNEPDASQVNFDLLPMEHIKRIEILSGSASLLGRNSLGGAINLVTRRGEGPTEAELELGGGGYGMRSAEGNVAGLTKSGIDYYIGGGYNRELGWRQATSGEQYNLFANIGKLTATKGIRLQVMGAKSDVQTAGSLPASVFAVRPDSNLSANDFEDLYNLQVALSGYKQVGGAGRASFNSYVRRHDAKRFNANQPDDPDVFGTSRNTVFGGTADYRTVQTLAGRPLSVRVGVDGSGSRTEVNLFADSAKFGGTRNQTTRVQSPVWDIGAFATADYTIGRMTLSAGGRFDFVRAPYRNLLDPTKDTTQNFRRFNPRVGLDADLGRGFSAYGSYGQAFRAPSVIEIACSDPEEPCPLPFALGDDPPIDPVLATTYEAGLRFGWSGIQLSASAYRTDLRNEIVLVPYEGDEPSQSTLAGYFDNIDKTRREGVEASMNLATRSGLSFYANYAWTKATYQTAVTLFSLRVDDALGVTNDVTPGDRLPLVPFHQVKGGLSVPIAKVVTVGLDGRWIGKQILRGDEANNDAPLNGYAVVDARIGAEVGPYNVRAVVTNLFDDRFAVFGGYNINQGNPRGPTLERFFTPGFVRQVRFMVSRSFGGAKENN